MRWFCAALVVCTVIFHYHQTYAQVPARLAIPGAVLVTQARPAPFRQQRIHADVGPPPRLRRPPPNIAPAPIRPVVEEPEDISSSTIGSFDDEVTKLGISALQAAVRQSGNQEEEAPRPLQFRPERPVPVLRQDIREGPTPLPRPSPVLRQEQRENLPRPLLRQELRDDAPLPIRHPQPIRQSQPRQPIPVDLPVPQRGSFRQQTRVSQPTAPRQPSQHLDEDGRPTRRKPIVQILRKYRTDNPDGSITWGYENEDGTFKEETLGIDCVTRGKYGYVDPDGVRREYSYETGNKCDEPEEEDEDLVPQNRPQPQPQGRKPPPQFRPAPAPQF